MRSSASLISSETRFISASKRRSILARFLAPRNFFARLVALGLQPLGCGDPLAALLIQRAEAVEINGDAAVRRHLLEFIQVFAKISQVMHAERIP